MATICVLLTYLNIPLGPVALTGQTLGILLIATVLKPKEAVLSVIIYLILLGFGLTGTNFAAFVSPTGGFLIGFIFVALISSLLINKVELKLSRIIIINLFSGIVVLYLIAIPFFMWFYSHQFEPITLQTALIYAFYPFVLTDIIKVILASIIGLKLRKRLSL